MQSPRDTTAVTTQFSVQAWLKARNWKPFEFQTESWAHIAAGREAFRPFAGYDYTKAPHPGVLFYQRFQWVWPRHPRVDYSKADEVCAALAAFRWQEEK